MIGVEEYCEMAMYDTGNAILVDRACYAYGLCPPNYPVPAIPLTVYLGMWGTYIFDNDGHVVWYF
jgi:hypothetical protein